MKIYTKLRFENWIKPFHVLFPQSSCFENWIKPFHVLFPQSSALKIKNLNLQIQSSLICCSDFLFIRDRGGIRTPNPQSRNLIFYPVELRRPFYYYINLDLTIVDIVFPSAFPASCLLTNPITFPISFMPSAPILSIAFTTTASISDSLNCSGKN